MSRHRTTVACALVVLLFRAATVMAQDVQVDPASLPTVKFFYYDAAGVEWAISAEPERLQQHLTTNATSRTLVESVSSAVARTSDTSESARQLTRWIENERVRFDRTRREPARIRTAEGIVAYLRDHDFSIPKLVEDLKHRSGASAVELVAIHLRERPGAPSFKLKVVLVDANIDIGRQGFNIDLPSPEVGYATVAYALGVALYGVQEIIHSESSGGKDESKATEELPVPASAANPLRTRNAREVNGAG
jgi:hypothetical protein